MKKVSVTIHAGEEIMLETTTIEAFALRLRGPMLCPGQDAYEAARTVWNGLIESRW